MNNNCAYFRLPYSDVYTRITSGEAPRVLGSYSEIGRESGFVVAPFVASQEFPLLLITPTHVETLAVPQGNDGATTQEAVLPACDEENYAAYAKAFGTFHDAVSREQFHKLVLSRSFSIDCRCEDVEEIFFRACRRYPRLMIQLFSTPQSGTWIIATPEILIESADNRYRTMALAGTMPYRNDVFPEWSQKNRNEQHIVEQYIEDTLSHFSDDIIKDGPATVRAGDLLHLRTDFLFRLPETHTLGEVIAQLHPTPAVCGLPTPEARHFIIGNETSARSYYSGFAGPVGIGGETHLYVSLRCARLSQEKATLYAGGGIMPDSQCEAEWQETQGKAQTILAALR